MGKLFTNPFRKKSMIIRIGDVPEDAPINSVPMEHRRILLDVARAMNLSPNYSVSDNITLFLTMAEVFFPIDFIASRIANAHFEIKKVSDDSIVWCTGRGYKAQKIAQILSRPNCFQTFSEFVYSHFVYRLCDGNAFIRSAMSDVYTSEVAKWRWCDNFWSIPPSLVTIQEKGSIPLFGICDKEDVIEGYTIGSGQRIIPAWQIWHDKDLCSAFGGLGDSGLLSPSRLDPLKKTVATLKAVYDARNIIYNRCGALGVITNKASDPTGHIAMDPKEKKELLDQFHETYGITQGKSPVAITDANVAYFRTGMSIAELQPFEESLLDAITIASQYGIPADLVPRKDNSTYDNKASAEKGVYSGVIIPLAKRFCAEFTEFLGIEKDGFYIDCNFDEVDCLQVGRKESEEVKALVNKRCRQQFLDGLICINDWRAQIHESALEGDVYAKTRFEMTDEELAFIGRVITNNSINKNPQQENGNKDEKSAGADQSE